MKKKILIIGDSNTLPRQDNKNFLRLQDIYVYKIKNFFRDKHFDVEQVSWGGITTSQLINFATNYFETWRPDFVLVHSGINDVKTQLFSSSTINKIYRILKILHINKNIFKNNFLYNNILLKYHAKSKTTLGDFSGVVKKIKCKFSNSKIFWIEIHADPRIDFERRNTYKFIINYNKIIKRELLKNFIKINFKKNHLSNDGFHLNKKGHLFLFRKIIQKIYLR
jgi:lysophospholipase L1-like esterase